MAQRVKYAGVGLGVALLCVASGAYRGGTPTGLGLAGRAATATAPPVGLGGAAAADAPGSRSGGTGLPAAAAPGPNATGPGDAARTDPIARELQAVVPRPPAVETAALSETAEAVTPSGAAAPSFNSGSPTTPVSVAGPPPDDGEPVQASALMAIGPEPDAGQPPPVYRRRLLMSLLEAAGVAPALDAAHVGVYGHAEASYSHNFARPVGGINNDHLFDSRSDDLQLNQFTLNVARSLERGVDADGVSHFLWADWVDAKRFNFGFRVEALYGTDAQFIHAFGMPFNYNGVPGEGERLEEQFDLPEAYVDLLIPAGNGLRARFGKFRSFLGGPIDPEQTTLYSRSFLFTSASSAALFVTARPFTFTGVLLTYPVSDQFLVDLGVVRGWDVSLSDNNSTQSVVGRVSYQFDKRWDASLGFVTGREPGLGGDGDDTPYAVKDNDEYRTLIDLIVRYQYSRDLLFILNADYGFEPHTGYLSLTHADADDRQYTTWYGVALYARYFLDPRHRLALNGRLEWFGDPKGSRLYFPGDRYGATVGMSICPWGERNDPGPLEIRPELRLDYAEKDIYDYRFITPPDFSPEAGKHAQLIFSVDMIFRF